MATTKKKKKTKTNSAKKVTIQSETDKLIQKLIDLQNSNTATMQKFNAAEAEKVRDYNTYEAATARQFNAQEAEKARIWQKQMSDTAHQREVADLKAAGLNPVLSANSGAQSYTSASANAQAASGQNANSGIDSAIGAISSLSGSLISAQATKDAAGINSAATKYASDNSLKAAQAQAEASKYAADMHYKTEMDKPQSSFVALADKYFNKLFPNSTDKSVVDDVKTSIKKKVTSDVIKSKEHLNNFLDVEGQSILGAWLLKNGYADTWKNKGLWLLSVGTADGGKYKNLMEKKSSSKPSGASES